MWNNLQRQYIIHTGGNPDKILFNKDLADKLNKALQFEFGQGTFIPSKTPAIPINKQPPIQPPAQPPIRQSLINTNTNSNYYYDFNTGSPRLKPPQPLKDVADIQTGINNNNEMRNTDINLLNNRTGEKLTNDMPVNSKLNKSHYIGGTIGATIGALGGGALGAYLSDNNPYATAGGVAVGGIGGIGGMLVTEGLNRLGKVPTGETVKTLGKVAIPLAVIGGIGYGGYHVATADDRARAKLEQEQLDNFNSILQAQKDREMVNEYIKQQKLKEQYETEKQWVLLNQLGNAVNNIPTLPYDVNNYLYTEQLMTPSY